MRYLGNTALVALLLACALPLSLASDSNAGFIQLTPEHIAFKRASGSEQATLFGDPTKPGLYVVRVRFPPGVHSNPHWHSQDRHVTVIQGIWYMGTGTTADISKAVPMKAGSYAFHPAHGVHWDGAGKEETIVQIVGMGPVETVLIDPTLPLIGHWSSTKTQ